MKCCLETDGDFARRRSDCRAKVYLDGHDEDDDEVFCDDCGRSIWPRRNRKHVFTESIFAVDLNGVQRWILTQLESIGSTTTMAPGIWMCQNTSLTAPRYVVLLDVVDNHSQYVTEDWLRSNCAVILAVDPSMQPTYAESWASPLPLVHLLSGQVELATAIINAPDMTQKGRVNVAARLYSTGHRAVAFTPVVPTSKNRTFVVELTESGLFIDNNHIIQAKATSQIAVYKILLRQYAEDLGENVGPDEFQSTSIDDIANKLARELGKHNEVIEVETARKHINRFQEAVTKTWKRTVGTAINDHDIIQSMQGEGLEGYRINPCTVIVKPRRGAL